MGARRRNRISYLVLLRRVTQYAFHACLMRIGMLVVIAGGAVLSERWLWSGLMTVPAALSCYLSIMHWRSGKTGNPPRLWLTAAYARSLLRTDSRHQLNMGSHLDIPGGFLLVVIPAWVTTDLALGWRLAMLAAAVCFLVNVAAGIFNDQTWFNPGVSTPPLWHEILRLGAGPVIALPIAAIALPAPWPPEGWWAVLVLAGCGLNASVRVWDTDITLRYTAPLVAEESRAGRDVVINEMHGALSTNLRLLEQQTRGHRALDPGLYDLAVSANSRLRETLALVSLPTQSRGDDLRTLAAPVYTLARAVGARVEVDIILESLGTDDRHLVRLVLNDLVGNALNAGAGAVLVAVSDEQVGSAERQVVVSVSDDAPPIPHGVWKTLGTSSARLQARLSALGGGLDAVEAGRSAPRATAARSDRVGDMKVVSARWQARSEGALASDEQQRDPSPAR